MKQSKEDLDAVLHWRGKFAAEVKAAIVLRQQLADVSNELDIAIQGALLGAQNLNAALDTRDQLQLRLNASEARNAEYISLLRELVALDPRGEFMGWELDARIDAALAQSAPATDEQGAV